MSIVDIRAKQTTVGGRAAHARPPAPQPSPGAVSRRRRSLPHLVIGALLVVSVTLAAAVLEARRDIRLPVLVAARSVPAGQVLTRADLTVAHIVPDPTVRTIPATDLDTTVGRTAALPLTAGALLAPGQVGPPAWPPAGQAVVAVAVKAGHAPPGLVEGSRVSVIVVTSQVDAGTARPVRVEAGVVSVVAGPEQQGTAVVSLLLADDDATALASATGDVSLVLRSAG